MVQSEKLLIIKDISKKPRNELDWVSWFFLKEFLFFKYNLFVRDI